MCSGGGGDRGEARVRVTKLLVAYLNGENGCCIRLVNNSTHI
jgi:hypothetical protein